MFSGVEKYKRAQRVISIMTKKKLKKYITNCEGINENIIKVNIDIFGKKVTILGVYGISGVEASAKKEEFYLNLNSVINEIGCSKEIIMMIDSMVELVTVLEVKLWVLMETTE